MEMRNEAEKIVPQADKHNLTFRFALFKEQDDEAKTMKWLDVGYDYSYGVPPGTQEEEEDAIPGVGGKSRRPSSHAGTGAGKGGTNTTVVVTNTGAPAAGGGGMQHVDGAGIDGVVSNPFAKDSVVEVDVKMTERKDLCCETYSCCFVCAGGHAWFFKMPDCLGGGCSMMSFFGSCANSMKFIQKPTFCEQVLHCSCLDMSTCCSDRGENDNTCCSACTCQCQETCCCLIQDASKCEVALMRTLMKCWLWSFILDYRCACPPDSSAPLQCTICGFGYRMYEGGGCGCRTWADAREDAAVAPAPGGGNTTVVVVQSN